MECNDRGFKWENNSFFADLFPTLHVAIVIIHAVIVVLVFYRWPKQIYYPESTTMFIQEGEKENQEIK